MRIAPFLPPALVALVLAAYSAAGGLGFVNYDDPLYVTENPMVRQGLTAESLAWAGTTFHTANWIPLTWLSHMLDVELFGLAPGPHHWTNVALHALNAVLVFALFAGAARRTWPAFIVAALFALHPLRVESVAWVSERKDVLSTTFALASLLAYVRYARTRSLGFYALAFLWLALGLLAKPMLVTLPFLYLLLDLWPLGRRASGAEGSDDGEPAGWTKLAIEKVPFVLLVGAWSFVTVVAQDSGGAVGSVEGLSLLDRCANAGLAYLAYVSKTFLPFELAVFYPHPAVVGWGALGALGSLAVGAVVLGAVTALLFLRRGREPFGLVGWLWFLGTLVPVIGLVQVGDQALADRYAYFPTLGLYVAIVYGFAGVVANRPNLRPHLAVVAGVVLVFFGVLTQRQVQVWKNSRALFEHAQAVTQDNYVACNNLGLLDLEAARFERALEQFQRATRINPRFFPGQYNLGLALEAQGRYPEAISQYERIVELRPGESGALVRLAEIRRLSGDRDAARTLYEQAVAANSDDAGAWTFLARHLLEDGEIDRAANCAASALKLAPERPEPHLMMGDIALRRAEFDAVEGYFLRAVELAPDLPQAHAKLGAWYVRKRENARAEASLARALELERTLPEAHMTLGMIRFGEGDLEGARRHFQSVLDENPNDAQAHNAMGTVLLQQGKLEEARQAFETALRLLPGLVRARTNLAVYHQNRGDERKAVETYLPALELEPADVEAARAVAWIFATSPDPTLLDGEEALRWADYAAKRQDLRAIEVLAAAHARKGEFPQAIEWQKRAIDLEKGPRRAELEERLKLYQADLPYTRTR